MQKTCESCSRVRVCLAHRDAKNRRGAHTADTIFERNFSPLVGRAKRSVCASSVAEGWRLRRVVSNTTSWMVADAPGGHHSVNRLTEQWNAICERNTVKWMVADDLHGHDSINCLTEPVNRHLCKVTQSFVMISWDCMLANFYRFSNELVHTLKIIGTVPLSQTLNTSHFPTILVWKWIYSPTIWSWTWFFDPQNCFFFFWFVPSLFLFLLKNDTFRPHICPSVNPCGSHTLEIMIWVSLSTCIRMQSFLCFGNLRFY